jgi:hypothetical protein
VQHGTDEDVFEGKPQIIEQRFCISGVGSVKEVVLLDVAGRHIKLSQVPRR